MGVLVLRLTALMVNVGVVILDLDVRETYLDRTSSWSRHLRSCQRRGEKSHHPEKSCRYVAKGKGKGGKGYRHRSKVRRHRSKVQRSQVQKKEARPRLVLRQRVDLAIGPTIHVPEKLVMDPALIWTGLDRALNQNRQMNQKEATALQTQILQEELVLCLMLMGLDHHPSRNYYQGY